MIVNCAFLIFLRQSMVLTPSRLRRTPPIAPFHFATEGEFWDSQLSTYFSFIILVLDSIHNVAEFI